MFYIPHDHVFTVTCRVPLLVILGMFFIGAAGCGGSASDSASTDSITSDAAEPAPVRVKLMLNWYPEAEHGGYYTALLKGYYAEAGLDVEIIPGGPNAPVVPQTARGAVEFGVTNADRILLARAEGANVKGLLAPLQTSPRCVLVHEQSGIESFDQLNDVTLMLRRENAWAQFLLKRLEGREVTVVPNTASLAPFLKDPRAAKQGYVISEPFVAKQSGAKVRSLLVAKTGFNPYTSVLMSSDDYLQQNPDIARRMVAASQRGWETYLREADETNERIHSLNPEMSVEVLSFGVEAIKQHCLDAEVKPFGAMSLSRWETLVDQLESLGMLEPGAVKAADAFTMKFVETGK